MSAWPSTKRIGFRVAGYDVLRVALGLLLLVAAALKGYQLGTGPVAESGLLTSRWFLIVVVEFELLLGLWLLAGGSPKCTWRLSVFCFLTFACVSLYEAICGRSNCGCFGNVVVNPRTTFALDVVLVAALLRWQPKKSLLITHRATFVFTIWLAVGSPAAYAMGSYSPTTLSDAGDIIGSGKVIVMEPEKWVGKPFPLLHQIDIGDEVAQGAWLVVLYHHDCPKCVKAIPRYRELARQLRFGKKAIRIALVEMPPYEENHVAAQGVDPPACCRGRLSDVNEWYVATPVELMLQDGTVCEVSQRPSGAEAAIIEANGPKS
jgi:hypothetical protein